jgi:hypothetical protein
LKGPASIESTTPDPLAPAPAPAAAAVAVAADAVDEEVEDETDEDEEEGGEGDASSSLQSPRVDAIPLLACLRRLAASAGRAPCSSHAVGSVKLTAAEPWRAPGSPLMKLSVPSSTIVR